MLILLRSLNASLHSTPSLHQIVWEVLAAVDGDTAHVNSNFESPKLSDDYVLGYARGRGSVPTTDDDDLQTAIAASLGDAAADAAAGDAAPPAAAADRDEAVARILQRELYNLDMKEEREEEERRRRERELVRQRKRQPTKGRDKKNDASGCAVS